MKNVKNWKRWQYIKLIAILLSFYPLAATSANAQIKVKGHSLSLEQAIKQIEQCSDYIFFYNATHLENTTKKDINCEGNIDFVLKKVLEGSNVEYMISEKEVVLKIKENRTPQTPQQVKKKRTIVGTVSDANTKETLVGASVKLKGASTGTITDLDGNFTLEVSGSKEILIVSFIGYKTIEQPVENVGILNILLPSDSELLNEVVVVGFGTQKKVSVVGAITNIKASSLKIPSSSLSNSFGGRLAGVISTTSSGEPGNNASDFYIRGIGTFGGRATPLIIMDGVEISTTDLNYIPAENIESFSILKDASATAIYGARGGNGVMIITTKVGKENEKTKINVSLESSINTPMSFPDFVDGVNYMEMYNEATLTRSGNYNGLPYSVEKIEHTRAGMNPYVYPNVNWKDLIFKKMSMNQRANINVSGGGPKANYYLSIQANHDSGVLNSKKIYSFDNNINIWSYIFQSNVDYKLTPTTKVGLRINAQIRNSGSPSTSTTTLFGQMLEANPVSFPAIYPSHMDEGGKEHLLFGNMYRQGELTYTNPYANLMTNYKEAFDGIVLTTVNLDQDLNFITKGLKLKSLISFRNVGTSSFTREIQPYYYMPKSGSYDKYDPTATGFTLERVGTSGTDYIVQSDPTKYADRTFQFQASLEWARTFAKKHEVSAMLLYQQREYRTKVLPTRNQGLSGRVTYAYDQRYLLEGNFGYNGTERLDKDHRFEIFPSLAAGWVVSNEAFFEPVSHIISNLKIRGSWGLVGNDETGLVDIRTGEDGPHFIYLTQVELGKDGYTTGVDMNVTNSGPKVVVYGMPNSTWERSEKINIGIDLELFRKLTMTFDVFQDNRSNILLRRERFPEYLGYASAKPWASIGKVRNRGIDASLNYVTDINKDWSLDVRGSFTINDPVQVYSDEALHAEEYRQQDGRALGGTWGLVAERLFVDQTDIDNSPTQRFGNSPMPGDIKYRDLNNDGKIDGADICELSPYGRTPRIMYGFGATVRYKKFDLGVFFQGAARRTITIGDIHPFGDYKKNVLQFIADSYWTEANPNPNVSYPRLDYRQGANNNKQTSSYWMRDGSFMRLKNAEVGYTFKYGRVYLTGENLLTFSKFKLWDPELASWNSYPFSRTFNLGIQLNF